MRFDHLHVYCRRLEPAIDFMTSGLGGELLCRREMVGKPGAEIRIGGIVLFLKEEGESFAPQNCAAKECGYNHLGFVVDDLEEALERLTARPDTRLVGEPFKTTIRRCAFIAGPDDLFVEIMQDIT